MLDLKKRLASLGWVNFHPYEAEEFQNSKMEDFTQHTI